MNKAVCTFCGIEFEKERPLRPRNFCCKEHRNAWRSEYHRTENPVNKSEFWTAERRAASRRRNLAKGENRTYKKVYGKHAHRVAAEMLLGRELQPGEIVHHKNGDKTDNRPENLEVMTQSEHASLHFKEYWRKRKGGDEKHDSKK